MSKRRRPAPVALALAALLGACGGGERAHIPAPPSSARAAPAASSTPPAVSPSVVFPPEATDADPFAYDAAAALEPTEAPGEESATFATTEVTYRSFDREGVPALLLTPKGVAGPYPCVVVGHGLGNGKETITYVRDLLIAEGYALFAIDARYHGERAIADATRYRREPLVVRALFQNTVVDLRRGLDWLEQRAVCRSGRIGYLGVSMGGFHGSLLAGADERVQAPVLMVSGADWRAWLGGGRPDVVGLLYEVGNPASLDAVVAALSPVDPTHWVGRVSPRPVLMINGEADDIVPPASARALHDAARDPKSVLWYPGGHAPTGDDDARVRQVIVSWLDLHLQP